MGGAKHEKYGTAEMISKYGNKYTAAACEMYQKHQLAAEFTDSKESVVIKEIPLI